MSGTNRLASYPEKADAIDRAWLDSHGTIPDGSFVQGLAAVVSFVDTDGVSRWIPYFVYDLPTSHMVGLLTAAATQATLAMLPRSRSSE